MIVSPIFPKLIELAQQAAAQGETPIAAAIVDAAGNLIATATNLTEAGHNPTFHAELRAINAACEKLQTRYLTEYDLYVTLEPCPMCAQAISFARIRRLYFGAYDAKGGGVEHGPRIFEQPTCHHRPEVVGGVMASECGDLLKKFFSQQR